MSQRGEVLFHQPVQAVPVRHPHRAPEVAIPHAGSGYPVRQSPRLGAVRHCGFKKQPPQRILLRIEDKGCVTVNGHTAVVSHAGFIDISRWPCRCRTRPGDRTGQSPKTALYFFFASRNSSYVEANVCDPSLPVSTKYRYFALAGFAAALIALSPGLPMGPGGNPSWI